MAAEGLINFVELKERLQELEEVQAATQREIDSLLHKGGQLEEMCRNKEALLERLKDIPVRQIDSLYPDERRRIYQIVGLRAITKEDGTVEVAGDLTDLCFGNLDPTLSISVLTLPGQTAFTRTPRPPTRRPGCASAL